MKILVVSSYLPYPLFSGGQVRLYNLISELSHKHEITLICEKRPHQTRDDIREVEKICKKVVTVERRKQWSVDNIFGSFVKGKSFLTTGHTHPEMRQKIADALVAEEFDLIHVETFYVMQNVPPTSIPIVLAEHNIEYFVYRRFMESKPLPLRPLLAFDIAKIKREEQSSWKRASKIVTVSHEDNQVIEKAGFRSTVIANGVNTDNFTYKDLKKSFLEREKRILFIGDYSWIQNRDTATWIIKEIWPKISLQVQIDNGRSPVKLWIVGRKIPDTIKNLTNDPDVIFDEKISASPTWEIFKRADVLLAPIRVGGGTSYKILESMACGTPVVTMHLSAESLHAHPYEHLLIGKTASDLAEKTKELLEDKKLYTKISSGGRKLIEQKYTWKMIAKDLDSVYKSL